MENKSAIINALCATIMLTEAGEDIEDMEYVKSEDYEMVVITYKDGCTDRVNVNLDSGISMIRDVLRYLY